MPNDAFSRLLDEFTTQLIAFAPKGGLGIVLFLAFWLVGSIAKLIIVQVGRRSAENVQEILLLLARIAKGGLVIFGLITALGTMGIDVSALVAGLGLTGFALGFAFRDALSNLLAGVLLILHRPFRRGDRIAVAGSEGVVREINLRYTVLDGEGKSFLIPNSILFTNSISLLARREPGH